MKLVVTRVLPGPRQVKLVIAAEGLGSPGLPGIVMSPGGCCCCAGVASDGIGATGAGCRLLSNIGCPVGASSSLLLLSWGSVWVVFRVLIASSSSG